MSTIKIRRGTTTPSAGSFAEGEPAFDMTAGKLYLKNNAGAMVEIGPQTLKTINGSSIVGAGNITIEGGGGGAATFENTFLLMGS